MKNFSEYVCRQLKYNRHRIRSKICFSLEIILNVFKCLTTLLVPLKLLFWKYHHFCFFQLTFSVNLLYCQFIVLLEKTQTRNSIVHIIRRRSIFVILIYFLFWSLSNLFLIKFLKFLTIYFGVVANIVSISGMVIDELKFF